jgi:hypothetical protein
MWKRLVMLAVFGLLTSCGEAEKEANTSTETPISSEKSADLQDALDFEDNVLCHSSKIEKTLSLASDAKLGNVVISGLGKFRLKSYKKRGEDWTTNEVLINGYWNQLSVKKVGYIYGYPGWTSLTYHFENNSEEVMSVLNHLIRAESLRFCKGSEPNEWDGCPVPGNFVKVGEDLKPDDGLLSIRISKEDGTQGVNSSLECFIDT